MTLAEQETKLNEFIRQVRELENAIIDSGLDNDLIKDALEDVAELGSELRASRHIVHKQQAQAVP